MKRSPITRRTPLRSKPKGPAQPRERKLPAVPAVAPKPRAVMAQIGLEFTPTPKHAPERNEGYRRWVASLACCRCGIWGFSQAAHPCAGRGLGQKSSDLDCFPLCCVRPGLLGCHILHDQLIGMTLEQRRERELRYTAQTQTLAREAGRPELLEAA